MDPPIKNSEYATDDLATINDSLDKTDRNRHAKVSAEQLEIPGYQILRKLGQGGMGAVYLALDQKLQREVAIKIISFAALGSTQSRERFYAEIRMAASLRHPNIAQLYSADEKDGVPFFVMEYVAGQTLNHRINNRTLEPTNAAEILETLAQAIQYCHDQGIVHRDLKPSNVLIDRDGTPKIADFGLAKALTEGVATTRTGEILGTPAFMSPEQATGDIKAMGPATDIYGLGAILYHALTGRPPFTAPSAAQTMRQVVEDEPVGPRRIQQDVPRDLETICLKCLAKQPSRRYGTSNELAEDLRNFLNEIPIKARPVSRLERASRWTRRRPALAGLILLIAITIPTIIGGLVFYTESLNTALKREKQARSLVEQELQRSQRLSKLGSELSVWLLNEHSSMSLRQLPGSTQIQNDVNERVREYLVAATPDMPKTSKYMRRFAHAYSLLASSQGGEGQSNLGQTQQALGTYTDALELFDEALRMDPDDEIAKKLKIVTLLKQADVQRLVGQQNASREAIAEARQIFETLVPDASNDFRSITLDLLQAEFAEFFSANQLDQAMTKLQQFESAIENRPSDPLENGDETHRKFWSQKMRGNLLQATGDPDKALKHFETALRIARTSFETDDNNLLALSRYGTALVDVGDAQSGLLQHDAALEIFFGALKIRRQQVDSDPADVMAKHNLAVVLSRISSQYLQLGRSQKQLQYALQTVEIRKQLADLQPENLASQRDLGIGLIGLGGALRLNEKYTEAIERYDQALQIATRLTQVEEPIIADFSLIGESEFGRALTFFMLLVEDWSDDGAIEETAYHERTVRSFQASLAAYDKIENLGQMTNDQKQFRNKVEQAQAFVVARMKEIRSQADDPEFYP